MNNEMTGKMLIAGLMISIGVFPGGVFAAEKKLIDGVAAIVNDEVILVSEVREKSKPIVAKMELNQGMLRGGEMRGIEKEILDNLINERLMLQQMKELHIEVSEQEVDAAIDEVRKQRGLSESALRAAIEAEGMDFKEYREVVRNHIQRSKLFAIKVRPRVKITEEDVKNWYTQNVNAASVSAVRLLAIFIPFRNGSGKEGLDEARKNAARAFARAIAGEDFMKLAAEFSADKTNTSAGDMGTVRKGTLTPDIERTIFSLKKGQIGEPVETDQGIYIFKVNDIVGDEARSLADVKEDIYRRLFEEEGERQFKAWMAEIRKESFIDVRLGKGE